MRSFGRPAGIAVLLLLGLAAGPGLAGAAGNSLVESVGQAQVDWGAGSIKVTGSGAPPGKGGLAQQRLMAVRAATVDGYRQLAESVNGVRVDSETVVKDFVVESDTIRTQVSALIRGARMGPARYLSDGGVEVDVALPMYGSGSSVADAIDLDQQIGRGAKAGFLPPAFDLGDSAAARAWPALAKGLLMAAGSGYTGCIVDCRTVALKPAMSPCILDEADTELYLGALPVDPDQVVNDGIVGYRNSMDAALASTERIGHHPLVIRALQVAGNFKADAVVSGADGATLAAANQLDHFLDRTRVVFVVK